MSNLSGKNSLVGLEMTYQPSKGNKKKVKIFGKEFVNKNERLEVIYNEKNYKIKEYINEIDNNYNNEDEINLKLLGINYISNLSEMFCECIFLISIAVILTKKNTTEKDNKNSSSNNSEKIYYTGEDNNNSSNDNFDDDNLYDIYSRDYPREPTLKLSYLKESNNNSSKSSINEPKWEPYKINNMSKMFYGCVSLSSLPEDMSQWDISEVKDISELFGNCEKLKIFFGCKSLKSLPDISKWITENVTIMGGLFGNCKSLKLLPHISKWNTSKVKDMCTMFENCSSLLYIPDISKWDTSNAKSMRCMFSGCVSLSQLPKISKWNISNLRFNGGMFNKCKSRFSLQNIFKLNIKKRSK